MPPNHITLVEWGKLNGVSWSQITNWVRAGKFKTAAKRPVVKYQWTIDEQESIPKRRQWKRG